MWVLVYTMISICNYYGCPSPVFDHITDFRDEASCKSTGTIIQSKFKDNLHDVKFECFYR